MALENEKAFPRGGNELSTRVSAPRSGTFQLFTRKSAGKRSKDKRDRKKKTKGTVQSETFITNKEHVMHLSYKTLVEGMVILGRVRRVETNSVSVCLPGHICGRLSISDISKLYSNTLQAIAKNVSSPQACYSMEQMFRAGQPLVVRVEALGPASTDVRLTTDPEKIQGHWPRSALKEGMMLVAAVRSEEEHVYIMDVGLSGVRAFLKKMAAHKYLKALTGEQSLGVGQVLRCVVVKAEVTLSSATVELSADPKRLNDSVPSCSLSLGSLIPSVRCEVAVSKVLRDGLEVMLSDNVIGHVHRNHLLHPLDQLESYGEDQEYTATLLYVMPTVKLPYLSLSTDLCPIKPAVSPLEILGIGALIENCSVMSIDGQGIVLQLGSKERGLRGYVSHQRALGAANQDPERSLKEELKSKFPIGSVHRCRVLDYDYMDQMFICSTERTLLNAKIIHPSSVTVGQCVWCEIDSIGPKAATVFVLGGEKSNFKAFTASVPMLHLSDVPLRHPEKKFVPGSRWKARVLSAQDLNVIMTLKPSLINSELRILASYEDAKEDYCYEGTVYGIRENGLLIKFYGNVAGFVPRGRITKDSVDLGTMFYQGQTVKCYVLRLRPKQESLFLTLDPPLSEPQTQDGLQSQDQDSLQTQSNEVEREEFSRTAAKQHCVLNVGQRYEVYVKETKENCLLVSGDLQGSTWIGKIPSLHLTDIPALAESLLEVRRGTKKLKAYCWSAEEPILTIRPSAGKFFKDKGNVKVIREGLTTAKKGQLVPCSITSIDSAGNMLLHVPVAGSSGPLRVPLQRLEDGIHSIEESLIQPHMGLIGCVKFGRNKERELSVKLSDVCNDFTESAVDLLQYYISDLSFIVERQLRGGSVLASLTPGGKVRGIVKEVSDAAAVVKLQPSRIVCSVPRLHQRKGSVKLGSKVEATVLFVDPVTDTVDITMRPLFMRRIASAQDGKLQDEVQVGSVLRAQVVLIKEEFVLVTLFGKKGQCKLAYVPRRHHINQLFPDPCRYRVGDKVHVVLKRVFDGRILVVFRDTVINGISDPAAEDSRHVDVTADGQSSVLEDGSEAAHDINSSSVSERKAKKVKTKVKKTQIPTETPDQSLNGINSNIHLSEPLFSSSEDVSRKNRRKSVMLESVIENCTESKVKSTDPSLNNGCESVTEAVVVSNNSKIKSVKRSKNTIREDRESNTERTASKKRKSVKSENVIDNSIENEVKSVDVSLHNCYESEGEAEIVSNNSRIKSVKRSKSMTGEYGESKAELTASKKKMKIDSQVNDDTGDSGCNYKMVARTGDTASEAAPALEVDFVWDPTPSQLPSVLGREAAKSDSSSEDEAEQQVTKKKHLSLAEKKELARQEEARIRDVEMKLMNEAQNPQTADDFDRLLLASPNNSALWVQYMAFHLQATEIEKARAVAEKAIKAISFREEADKLNVWVALLNLENLYGTTESLNSVLKDAVQMNDAQTVYLKMLQIYSSSKKVQEAEQLVNLVCKKFKNDQEVWIQAGTVCMKLGLVDKARSLLQRALASLDKKLHVATITKFAQLEQQWGSAERAQTLMEQVLTSYPQRVDVWSSYVDMLVKSGSLDMARLVLERAVVQKLPIRKMKTLFKKYLEFEEKHGSPEGVAKVRQMALNYVQSVNSQLGED